jgi:2-oxoisovalerate dehydrogenase E2 component (dihydrolipoyl transacylase)
MAEHVIKLPDVGEGVAEAELVEWHVKVGELVREDSILAAVMTDKATVEIPSPADGEVVWLGAEIGDTVAVGAPLIRLKVEGVVEGDIAEAKAQEAPKDVGQEEALAVDRMAEGDEAVPPRSVKRPGAPTPVKVANTKAAAPSRAMVRPAIAGAPRSEGEKPLAAHEDLDDFIAGGPHAARSAGLQRNDTVEDIKVVGLRRKIAEKMALAKSRIPHITYVEEVDVGEVEELRAALNKGKHPDQPKLTLLPFLMRAMVKAIAEQPGINALFDDEAGVIHQHGGVHIGIATQTPAGLVVPVVRHAEALDIWACGAELNRLAEAARAGTATREELSGSTITITSLGAIGGIVTTPVINYPEVAIVGVNKIMIRPVWDGTQFIPRKMMNLSSSFDHRVVDGWDAAVFIQRVKALLETPAMIFVEG